MYIHTPTCTAHTIFCIPFFTALQSPLTIQRWNIRIPGYGMWSSTKGYFLLM